VRETAVQAAQQAAGTALALRDPTATDPPQRRLLRLPNGEAHPPELLPGREFIFHFNW
jgi:hypothetical protein